jgi:cell division protein FtsW
MSRLYRQGVKTPSRQSGHRTHSENQLHSAIGRKHRPDYGLLVAMLLLVAIGLIVIYSISPALSAQLKDDLGSNHFMMRQLLFLALGFSVFTFAALVPLSFWSRFRPYLIGSAIISFFFLFIPALSITYLGATRWVHIGPINYQPAEVLKLGLVLYVAAYLAHRIREGSVNDSKTTKWFLIVIGLVGLEIVIIQRDLGTMIPIAAIMLAMLYVSGIEKKRFLLVAAALVTAGALAIVPFQHRRERVFTFLNSTSDSQDSGWHINQALIAVGSGGLMGRGLGQSVQAYGYVPEAANDSIFAIMSEKFGFIGMMSVFAVYGALLLKIISITKRAPNHYLQLICAGVFAWIATQAFVNIGAMLSIMPLTGVTLPFLSFGGTSLIFTMAALGIVFNISKYTTLANVNEGVSHANTYGRRRVGRPRYAA